MTMTYDGELFETMSVISQTGSPGYTPVPPVIRGTRCLGA